MNSHTKLVCVWRASGISCRRVRTYAHFAKSVLWRSTEHCKKAFQLGPTLPSYFDDYPTNRGYTTRKWWVVLNCFATSTHSIPREMHVKLRFGHWTSNVTLLHTKDSRTKAISMQEALIFTTDTWPHLNRYNSSDSRQWSGVHWGNWDASNEHIYLSLGLLWNRLNKICV